jgi:hypothetical protein
MHSTNHRELQVRGAVTMDMDRDGWRLVFGLFLLGYFGYIAFFLEKKKRKKKQVKKRTRKYLPCLSLVLLYFFLSFYICLVLCGKV